MPHEEPPQEDLRLFDEEGKPEIEPEIFVPPMPHVETPEPETVAPPPVESSPPAKSKVPTAAQQEQIDKYLDQFSLPEAYEMVMGTKFKALPPRTVKPHTGRTAQSSEVLHRAAVNPQPKTGNSRALDTADSDARIREIRKAEAHSVEMNARERAENIENPPQ